ncbi:MAG TPA: helix-turn-helix transcriptional regulator [Streptosporangiaceae bacterium]
MPADDSRTRTPEGVFGKELRYYRERAGLSQTELAALVNVSHDVISKIETGERPPADGFPERLDAVPQLDTRGGLARLWGWLKESTRHKAIPGWFAPWTHFEAQAATLRSYEPMLVPGLFQTADYARAILGAEPGAEPDTRDEQVAARMDRQVILERADAPQIWSVLDEAVLHRCIGSTKIMRDQLEHLAALAGRPRVTIQVIPAAVREHAGLLGGFAIAELDGSPGMVYLETSAEGLTTDSPAMLAHAMFRFDTLRAEALPRVPSRDLIMKVAEGKWT